MPIANDHTPAILSFKAAISPAVRTALTDYWGNEDILSRPEIIADLGAEGVSRINRIGRKSLLQIARALESCGHIESPDLWLTKGK